MTDVTALFCSIDDFWTDFENRMTTSDGQVKRLGTYSVRRISRMCMSEVMTIGILFHIQGYRNRSPVNSVVNLLGGLIAYTLQPKKPKIILTPEEEAFLSLEHVVV